VIPKGPYFDELETASRNQILEYHNDRLRSIVVHAYANAPAFRKKMEEAGTLPSDIKSIDDLNKIPITSKEDLIKLQKAYPPFGGVVTVPIRRLKAVCMSPGPIYNTPGNDESYFRRVERSYFGCGLRPGDILLNTFSYHISPMGLKDHLALNYELRDSSLNREEMEASFRISFRDICRLNLDKITCVPGGTLSMDGKEIVDERKNTSG